MPNNIAHRGGGGCPRACPCGMVLYFANTGPAFECVLLRSWLCLGQALAVTTDERWWPRRKCGQCVQPAQAGQTPHGKALDAGRAGRDGRRGEGSPGGPGGKRPRRVGAGGGQVRGRPRRGGLGGRSGRGPGMGRSGWWWGGWHKGGAEKTCQGASLGRPATVAWATGKNHMPCGAHEPT